MIRKMLKQVVHLVGRAVLPDTDPLKLTRLQILQAIDQVPP